MSTSPRSRLLSVTLGAWLLAGVLASTACNLHEELRPIDPAAADASGGEDARPGEDAGAADADEPSPDASAADAGGDVGAPDAGADAGCDAPDDAAFCAAYGKNCGEFTGVDTCGDTRTVDCGTCTGGDVCGSGTENVCGCPCEIDGTCRPSGATNPLNPCEVCNPFLDTTAWSIDEGGLCDDGDLCTTAEVCDAAGVCGGGAPIDCGALDGACVTGVCDPNTGQCTTAPTNDGGSCEDGLDCASGVCDTGACIVVPDAGSCAINDACYAEGTVNSLNRCEVCDPGADPTGWSPAPAGTSCGDTSAACVESGQCVGTTCELTYLADYCFIGGTCYVQTESSPTSTCLYCDPRASQTNWTMRPQGEACGSMGNCSCSSGACTKPNGSICP